MRDCSTIEIFYWNKTNELVRICYRYAGWLGYVWWIFKRCISLSCGLSLRNYMCTGFQLLYRFVSELGFDPDRLQHIIQIGSVQEQEKATTHEMFHLLGRIHEHSRTDRDQYVRINTSGLPAGNLTNTHTIYSQCFSYKFSRSLNSSIECMLKIHILL